MTLWWLKPAPKSGAEQNHGLKVVKDIRRATRKPYASEKKIRFVLADLRDEEIIAELRRREDIAESLCYSWSKEFLAVGKNRLAGDTARQTASSEVEELWSDSAALKAVVAVLTLETRLLKKTLALGVLGCNRATIVRKPRLD